MPLSIRILKKCIEHRIDASLIKHLHFYDLQCLIFQFDIAKIQDYLKHRETQDLQKRGIDGIKDISGKDALKFLGR